MMKNSKKNEEMKLLIVDDDNVSQKILGGVFNNKGYNVDIACDGYECILKVIENTRGYVAILMDINMDKMGGIKATKILRGGKYKGLIIGIGGSEGDRESSLESGMDHFFVKPPDFDQLFDIIENKKTSR